MNSRIRRWFPFFAWIALIFGASSIPGGVTRGVDLPTDADKLIHFFEYLVFAVLFYRGLSYDSGRVNLTITFVVIMTGGGIAGLDEMYQSYIPGRDSSFLDLVADFTGVVAGSIFATAKHVWTIKRGRRDEI
ncbi:MAG: VanZ family protein [Candidatus Krumholzibacteriota bacterium]|nr:VanZ family protein [Candidatus Krumholzibacteriota bacterium]